MKTIIKKLENEIAKLEKSRKKETDVTKENSLDLAIKALYVAIDKIKYADEQCN